MAREQSEFGTGSRGGGDGGGGDGGGGGIMWSSVESGSNRLCLSYFSPDADEPRRCYPLFTLSSSSQRPKIVDSCDGLLLLTLSNHQWLYASLFVGNPVTKSYELLPSGSGFARWIYTMNWSIAYDASTKRYKVIGVTLPLKANIGPPNLMVFDFHAGSWKVVEKAWQWDPVAGKLMARVSRPGKLHWLIEEYEKEDMGLKTNLLSMDISNEVFTLRTVPNLPPSRFSEHSTVSSGGRVYHTRTCPESMYELDVWVMDDLDNPAWSRYHVLREKPPSVDNFTSWNQFEVVGILQEGTKLIIKLWEGEQILIYDIGMQQWQRTLYNGNSLNSHHDAVYHSITRRDWKEEGSSDCGSISSTRE